MRYLESRLRDISNKNAGSSTTTLNHTNGQRRISNGAPTNGHYAQQQSDTLSVKSRTSSIATAASKETPPSSSRQLGRQHLRSSGNIAGGETNGHQPLPPPRRSSQSSVNQGIYSIKQFRK